MSDRDYYFWIATFDSEDSDFDPVGAVDSVLAAARAHAPAFTVAGYEIYADVGTVAFETTAGAVRNWRYFVIAELDEGVNMEALLSDAPPALQSARWAPGVLCLSSEITVRPQGAGTCIPRAQAGRQVMPAHFRIGVEYIHVPEQHWTHYQDFMRAVYGPIGVRLVQDGHFHKIVITEGVHRFHQDDAMPVWNCVHLSSADFDDERDGALARVEEAVRKHLGPQHTIASSMDPVRGYRTKPKMSKNRLVHSTWRHIA